MQQTAARRDVQTDAGWLLTGLSRLFLNIVEVGGEKARCGVPKLASSGMHATAIGDPQSRSKVALGSWMVDHDGR